MSVFPGKTPPSLKRPVAGFIGSPKMNLINAQCDGAKPHMGCIEFALPNFSQPLGEVIVGIRPEQFDEPASAPHGFTVRAQVVENLGGTSIAHEGYRMDKSS